MDKGERIAKNTSKAFATPHDLVVRQVINVLNAKDFDINKQFMKTNKEQGKGEKPKYRYETKPVVQIGNGRIEFDFETLNGDVYIKKI